MNMMKTLKEAIKVQDIDLELNEIPINIFLKHNGDILEFCFIEKESEDAFDCGGTCGNRGGIKNNPKE